VSVPALPLLAVALVVVATVGIGAYGLRLARTTSDFLVASRSVSPLWNASAIGGEYLSAASFLGIAGAIALNGYDGFLYSVGFLVAWLVALLLVAELLRNTGKYTMGDVLAFRMRQRPVRAAAATSTLTVSFMLNRNRPQWDTRYDAEGAEFTRRGHRELNALASLCGSLRDLRASA